MAWNLLQILVLLWAWNLAIFGYHFSSFLLNWTIICRNGLKIWLFELQNYGFFWLETWLFLAKKLGKFDETWLFLRNLAILASLATFFQLELLALALAMKFAYFCACSSRFCLEFGWCLLGIGAVLHENSLFQTLFFVKNRSYMSQIFRANTTTMQYVLVFWLNKSDTSGSYFQTVDSLCKLKPVSFCEQKECLFSLEQI